MSDPEAGEGEGIGENPDPEDYANCLSTASDNTEDAFSSGHTWEQAEASGGADSASRDRTESCSASTEDLGTCADKTNDEEALAGKRNVDLGACGGAGDEESKDESDTKDQEEPPECERLALPGDGQVETVSCNVKEKWEADFDATHPEQENAESAQAAEVNGSVAQGSPDIESPPEDELFSTVECREEEWTGVEENATDETAGEDLPEDQAPGLAEFNELGVEPVAQSSVDEGRWEGGSEMVGSEAQQTRMKQSHSREASEGPDSDQAPECDREQTAVDSSPPASCDTVNNDQSLSSATSQHSAQSSPAAPSQAGPSPARTSETVSSSCGEQTDASGTNFELPASSVANSPPPPRPAHPPNFISDALAEGNVHASTNIHSDENESGSDRTASAQSTSPSHSSPSYRLSPQASVASTSTDLLKRPVFLDEDSDEEELLTELDAELQLRTSPRRDQAAPQGLSSRVPLNGLKDDPSASTELCKQFEAQLMQLQETILQRDREIQKLKEEKNRQREVGQDVLKERDRLKAELTIITDKNPDDIYLPQIKALENTISQQQNEIRQLKDKLTAHDSAAKRAINTLQSEMKARIDQITKLYEDACKEKDSMVMKFAEAETKNIGAKYSTEKMESRVRDMMKEKEFMNNKMRAALAEKQKAGAELQAKMGEVSAIQKEMEKMKEDMSSMDYRLKWHQNKLRAELEAHKETKTNLDRMTSKWKEAKEETEVIRKDTQAIVKKYQESEEVRSNSLDKELKLKEAELMIKMKEKTDTEEIHHKTKRELDMLKSQHKDTMAELHTLRDKVQSLEEERLRQEEVQAKYEGIIQHQKTDNAGLAKQLSDHHALQEDFQRAQDMIKSLDHEMSELKLTNRDLQKDIEGCQARESKMLTLQSELSRTNAFLRSENTNLSNQVATFSGDVQKMQMDIQDLDTRCRNLTDQLEEEQKKRKEETETLSTQLTEKTKESAEYKQKWEDEVDSSKTWKRKHASNVKDLTRQLQHAKKRLEVYDTGSGDRDTTSMGSRTNSNGSLNSMDNANQHNHSGGGGGGHHNHHPAGGGSGGGGVASRSTSQEPEFPVITEQVEVDKQVLIERIVRLQRSLARKNEKLEFLEEHIQQLVAEIKRKNKLIQGYVVREESGTLASDVMDANKLAVKKEAQALLARKGGIMASVYSKHQQDDHMTLDLSLEINKKLQAVLEDTLLKNMTLKENLDTLGGEIARLSQENRRLQLHLQGLG